jgi:hypothetical protein
MAATLIWTPAASAFECGVRLDNFNRADSAGLGSNWLSVSPGIGIDDGVATNPSSTEALSTFKGRKAAQACVDVSVDVGSYVALVLGYRAETKNLFVKVQDNDSNGTFDSAYFYRGNNGDALVTPSDRSLAPFTSARVHLLWSKSRLVLEIDTDFDNQPEQTIRARGFSTSGLGTGIGLGIYRSGGADNFSIGLPETRISSSQISGSKHKATFKLASPSLPRGFVCSLDGGSFRKCGSTRVYRHLSRGRHTFSARARDWVGNLDPTPARLGFRI